MSYSQQNRNPCFSMSLAVNNCHSNLLPDNFVPESYRQVSVQPYNGEMTEDDIRKHLVGKDAYRRTEYIILEQSETCAIAMISRPDDESLFSPIKDISLVALPTTLTRLFPMSSRLRSICLPAQLVSTTCQG